MNQSIRKSRCFLFLWNQVANVFDRGNHLVASDYVAHKHSYHRKSRWREGNGGKGRKRIEDGIGHRHLTVRNAGIQ